jgi:predicted RNA-binding protein with PIN domain
MAGALDGDDDFRDRVGVQVAAKLPAPVTDLVEVPADADPVELAALAWLVRPEGWAAVVAAAEARLAERGEAAPVSGDGVERWREKAQAAEQALRDARTRHRSDLADLKAENSQLRRKLGETRTALAAATTAAEEAATAADDVRRQADAAASTHQKELRQLRARLDRLEAEAQQDRRTARADRDEASIRVRVLLDTLVDAANGLRRELSLPAVSGAPADRLEAELAEADASTGGRPVTPSSPALLEQFLAMPRARLIVDGYNVSKTAWVESSLEAQRTRLLNGLAPLVARTGAETTVVFDAAATSSRPVVSGPRGVKVRFSPEGVIADDVIRDLVAVEPPGRVVVVVSSDQELVRDVARGGARAVSSDALIALLGSA